MTSLSEKEHLVRSILSDPCDVVAVAFAHGVSEGTVRNVKMLKTKIAKRVRHWMVQNGEEVHLLTPAKRFTPEQVQAIRRSTKPSTSLAKLFDVSPSTIRMIRTYKSYG